MLFCDLLQFCPRSPYRHWRSAPQSPRRSPKANVAPLSPESPTHPSRRRARAVNGSIAKSLRRFADYGELKKAALMVTAFQLDRGEIKLLKVRLPPPPPLPSFCRGFETPRVTCVASLMAFFSSYLQS